MWKLYFKRGDGPWHLAWVNAATRQAAKTWFASLYPDVTITRSIRIPTRREA